MLVIIWLVLISLLRFEISGHVCKEVETSVCMTPHFMKSVRTNQSYAYEYQRLIHCTKENHNNSLCVPYWNPKRKQYTMRVKEHYERLIKFQNHSLNLMNSKLNAASKVEAKKRLLIDVVVDARCHHSWPYNPYHRYADCLMFILPSLYNYLSANWVGRGPSSRRRVALIVDESSEMLCEYLNLKTDFEGNEVHLNPDDVCLLTHFQSILRTRYYYQCIKISIFHKTAYWYKLKHRISVLSNELIWLEEQRNPYTGASGFMNEKHPAYGEYIKDFRRIFFQGFCHYCDLNATSQLTDVLRRSRAYGLDAGDFEAGARPLRNSNSSSNSTDDEEALLEDEQFDVPVVQDGQLGGPDAGSDVVLVGGGGVIQQPEAVSTQTTILVLRRRPGTGRDIPQHDELLAELQRRVDDTERYLSAFTDQEVPKYRIIEYTGSESFCETIAMYWSSKVIVAAHGAGIVNTIFSRPYSLLIEISPDKLEPGERGVPWRMNSPFARSVGVSTHVVVVPHNESAKANSEIQKVYPMSLNRTHIERIGQILFEYLIAPKPENYQTTSIITSLV